MASSSASNQNTCKGDDRYWGNRVSKDSDMHIPFELKFAPEGLDSGRNSKNIVFQIMILGRQQGGVCTFRTSPTDNAPKTLSGKLSLKRHAKGGYQGVGIKQNRAAKNGRDRSQNLLLNGQDCAHDHGADAGNKPDGPL